MKATLSIFFLSATIVAPLLAEVETRQSYSASAFALDSDELLYVERHVETWRQGRLAEREVRYEDPAGELIAEKLVRYGESPEAPSFEMTHFRLGLREGAEVGGEEVELFSGPATRRQQARTVPKPAGAVIDAGFDAFMRENFADIVEGERLEFDFAVPAIGRFFKFRLVPEGRLEYEGTRALLVKMKPASRLLRLVVDPIDLVYGLDGRLLEFRGLANVSDPDGDRYKARIVFEYPDEDRPSAVATVAARPAP